MQTFPKEFIYLTNNTWICSLCGITAESPGSERTLSDRGSLVTASTGIPIVPSPSQDSASLRMRLRLLPGYRTVACQLVGTAGTCNFVWNHFLTCKRRLYQPWREYRIGPKPSLTLFSMGKEITTLSRDPCQAGAWLSARHAQDLAQSEGGQSVFRTPTLDDPHRAGRQSGQAQVACLYHLCHARICRQSGGN